VKEASIIKDANGKSRGFGFVTFEKKEVAEFLIKHV